MIKFNVLNRFSGNVQFTAEIECDENEDKSVKLGLAVKWALKTGADLCYANLRFADLHSADLHSADLGFADLHSANLRNADLSYADLCYVNLRFADLGYANLHSANLRYADLGSADLHSANLRNADLCYADLGFVNGISDRIINGGLRSDGYRFLLTRVHEGDWRIQAGCRNFTVKEGKSHWDKTRPRGEMLGDETRLIIKHMLVVAKLRKWPTT